jgi:hypothetical protein
MPAHLRYDISGTVIVNDTRPRPTVFVVDDDDLVRASIQGMLKSVGLRSEGFGTAQDLLPSKWPDALVWFLTSDFPESAVWIFIANWPMLASGFPLSLSPVMATFQ